MPAAALLACAALVSGGAIASANSAHQSRTELSRPQTGLAVAAPRQAEVGERGVAVAAPSAAAAFAQAKAAKIAAANRAARAAALATASRAQRASRSAARAGAPKDIARLLLPAHGWGSRQFACLDALWSKESDWTVTADNPGSSAYGIPQALPGAKMAAAGADWRTNPHTQITWGLGYIEDVYGTPCEAWAHSRATNWY